MQRKYHCTDATLTQLINQVLESGEFPNCLKETTIIPIYKGGKRNLPRNYRPIALINTFSKIIEKIIKAKIVKFIQETGGFDETQYGFQENSNTQAAVMDVINYINNQLDNGKYVVAVYIDLKKAFDTVDHRLLLEMLDDLGIRGVGNKLIETYLNNRTIVTNINESISGKEVISKGVPQGSVLGPLLYLLYIQNINRVNFSGKYVVYADDTVLLQADPNPIALEHKVNKDLTALQTWINGNRLTLNAKKTEYIIFNQKNKKEILLNIKIDAMQITQTKTAKYLGLTMDDKLQWEKHAETVASKLVGTS